MLLLRCLFILTVMITSISCQSDKKASLPPLLSTVVSTKPAKNSKIASNQIQEIRLSGQVSSLNKAKIGFQTAGIISHVYAKPGMLFKKGQTLAVLDSRDYVLREQMAKLQQEQESNQKSLAERNFNIEKQLRGDGINSPMQLEDSKILYENAKIKLKIAKTNWEIAQKNLHETQLRAPYDCVVVKQIKFVGESTMGPGDSGGIFEINELGVPELYISAPEKLLGQIKVGDFVQIFFPALNDNLPAKVVRYVPIVSELTRHFLIVAQLDKIDRRIVPGYFIEATLKLKQKN
jgi:membrane fusion protein, multidrug efflux system